MNNEFIHDPIFNGGTEYIKYQSVGSDIRSSPAGMMLSIILSIYLFLHF